MNERIKFELHSLKRIYSKVRAAFGPKEIDKSPSVESTLPPWIRQVFFSLTMNSGIWFSEADKYHEVEDGLGNYILINQCKAMKEIVLRITDTVTSDTKMKQGLLSLADFYFEDFSDPEIVQKAKGGLDFLIEVLKKQKQRIDVDDIALIRAIDLIIIDFEKFYSQALEVYQKREDARKIVVKNMATGLLEERQLESK